MLNCQKLVVKNCQHHKIATMLLQFCGVVSKFCDVVMNFLAKKGCLGILCSCCNFSCSKTWYPTLLVKWHSNHPFPLCYASKQNTDSILFFHQTHCTSAKVLYVWCNFYNFHNMLLLFTTTNLLRMYCIFCEKVQWNTLIKAQKLIRFVHIFV